MKINEKCLPCLINQVIKVANITNCSNRDDLYHQVFEQLSKIDFNKSNPEIIGMIFELVKKHLNNEDPYQEIRQYYNNLFKFNCCAASYAVQQFFFPQIL